MRAKLLDLARAAIAVSQRPCSKRGGLRSPGRTARLFVASLALAACRHAPPREEVTLPRADPIASASASTASPSASVAAPSAPAKPPASFSIEWRHGFRDDLLVSDVWASGATDVYVVGYDQRSDHGLVLRSGGDGHWRREAFQGGSLSFVTGSSATDVYAGGEHGLHRSTGIGHWHPDVRADAPSDVQALEIDGSRLVALDGCCSLDETTGAGSWRRRDLTRLVDDILGPAEPSEQADRPQMYPFALAAVGGDVYLPSGAVVAHRRGGKWTLERSRLPIHANHDCSGAERPCDPRGDRPVVVHGLWASPSGDVYMVATDGVIARSTGHGDWKIERRGISDLLGIHGCSATDIWAVGRAGTVLHSEGDGKWTVVPTGIDQDVRAVACVAADDVYAVASNEGALGSDQVILHYH